MIDFMTADELRTMRRYHMASCNRLRELMPTLSPIDAARAEGTMANLMQQVYVIDAELAMASKGMRGVA